MNEALSDAYVAAEVPDAVKILAWWEYTLISRQEYACVAEQLVAEAWGYA